jgi:hypothetical protein
VITLVGPTIADPINQYIFYTKYAIERHMDFAQLSGAFVECLAKSRMQKALCSKICLSSYQSGLKSIFVDELSCGGLQLLADVDHRHAGLHPTLDVLTGLPVSFGGLKRIEKMF